MTNPNRSRFTSHESDGPIKHISINNSDINYDQELLDLEAIEKDIKDHRERNQELGKMSNEVIANKNKAKHGPLKAIVKGVVATLVTIGVIAGIGSLEKISLEQQKKAEEEMRNKNLAGSPMHFNIGSDSSTLIGSNGKVYTVENNGRSEEEVKNVLIGMMDDDIKNTEEREAQFGE